METVTKAKEAGRAVVTGTRWEGGAMLSNCVISYCAARFMLERPPQRIILGATNPVPWDLWHFNALPLYAYYIRSENKVSKLFNLALFFFFFYAPLL